MSLAAIQDTGENCIVIGINTNVFGGASNVFLYGDNLSSDVPNYVGVGDTLFGEKIPDTVRTLLADNPEDVRWVLESVCKFIQGAMAESDIL